MAIENISSAELLQFLTTEYKIDTNTILQSFEMSKREEILKKHPCRIWQGATNGMWYTYIPLQNGKRRLVKKKNRKQVEDVIIDFYKDEPTVEETFNKWLDEKKRFGEIQNATCDRYATDYRRYFNDSKLKDRKIKTITESEIEEFIKNQILINNLTSKAYGGLRTIIIGIWGYAYKHKYTDVAIKTFFSELQLSGKMFKVKPKYAEDEVFFDDETDMLTEHFMRNNPNVISYGIILAMRTGLRVGELCSLTWDDVDDHCIKVCKTETRYRISDSEYTREVKDNAKTEAGNRIVLIDDKAVELLRMIKSLNPNGEYVFEINGKRCRGQSFTRKLERACDALGIKPRPMHKCRKTYITTLINANVPESLIIDQVGHTDIKTSKQFYLYNNKTRNEALKTLSDAICKK